jgi:hypothetical protein
MQLKQMPGAGHRESTIEELRILCVFGVQLNANLTNNNPPSGEVTMNKEGRFSSHSQSQ